MIFDTIVAVATPFGTGGISVLRVSGSEAIQKVNSIFNGKDLSKVKSHTAHYGFILDSNSDVIDEVMVTVMKAPRTFTKEDVVEISAHGGVLITNNVLTRVLSTGIRMAERGEFTERAFLNGRIDLIQAESINDLIHAKNNNAVKIAAKGISKETSNQIINLREEVLDLIAKIEVNIDYPEYDDAIIMTKDIVVPAISELVKKIDKILILSRKNMMIKEGIKTAIIGKPNVGKSSLLNALLDEDKAIVSDYAGTTRDTIEATINLAGITLNLIDTAGIRETKDYIETLGIERSIKAISEAELILLVLDQNQKLSKEDQELLDLTKNKKRIIIKNKADLNDNIKLNEGIKISSVNKTGLKELENQIIKILSLEDIENSNLDYLSNTRQIGKLEEAKIALGNAIENQGLPIDLLVIDITKAYTLLLEILGEEYQDNLLNELFSKFCLGK
ncbi:tRNA uridine-5-carboxymethylaminomethyl(34) synthesis GTPase MnmE [Acholeplasma sp. OttesenSCG-928-E16]|nr:tRNA uridine-5-carboxymethylaminomethyl(34) synthesis GTPase MnmE [Acholeplasma sp. OttesenSCG-928-E16]